MIDRKLDANMRHRTDKEYRNMWINNGYSKTELRYCIYHHLKDYEEFQFYGDFWNKVHESMRQTFKNVTESNYEVASVLIYLVVTELRQIKSFLIPNKILPEDKFTEMLANFCYVYRINIDRNQICFIYENELNETTANKIQFWDLD